MGAIAGQSSEVGALASVVANLGAAVASLIQTLGSEAVASEAVSTALQQQAAATAAVTTAETNVQAAASATLATWGQVSTIQTNLTEVEVARLQAVKALTEALVFEGAGEGTRLALIEAVVPALQEEAVATLAVATGLESITTKQALFAAAIQTVVPALTEESVATLAVINALDSFTTKAQAAATAERSLQAGAGLAGIGFRQLGLAASAAANEAGSVAVAGFQGFAKGAITATDAVISKLQLLGSTAILVAGPLSGVGSRIATLGVLASQFGASTAVVATGVALLVAVLATSISKAAEFETAITGVAKTTNASADELAAIRSRIFEISSELGISAVKIAGITEIAGQLGIRGSANLAAFTAEIAKLSRTTELDVGDAARSLAILINTTNEAPTSVTRLSSEITALGNNFAGGEAKILGLATELGRSSGALGLTADQALTLGAALSAMGVRAESGGTAVGRVIATLSKAAETGGAALNLFALLTEQSSASAAASIRTNIGQATIDLISALGRLQSSGQSVIGILDQFGLSGVREQKALDGLIGNAGQLAKAQGIVADQTRDATATNDEFARSSETLARQLEASRTAAENGAIAFGTKLLGAIKSLLADAADPFLRFFAGANLLLDGAAAAAERLADALKKIPVPKFEFPDIKGQAEQIIADLKRVFSQVDFGAISIGPASLGPTSSGFEQVAKSATDASGAIGGYVRFVDQAGNEAVSFVTDTGNMQRVLLDDAKAFDLVVQHAQAMGDVLPGTIRNAASANKDLDGAIVQVVRSTTGLDDVFIGAGSSLGTYVATLRQGGNVLNIYQTETGKLVAEQVLANSATRSLAGEYVNLDTAVDGLSAKEIEASGAFLTAVESADKQANVLRQTGTETEALSGRLRILTDQLQKARKDGIDPTTQGYHNLVDEVRRTAIELQNLKIDNRLSVEFARIDTSAHIASQSIGTVAASTRAASDKLSTLSDELARIDTKSVGAAGSILHVVDQIRAQSVAASNTDNLNTLASNIESLESTYKRLGESIPDAQRAVALANRTFGEGSVESQNAQKDLDRLGGAYTEFGQRVSAARTNYEQLGGAFSTVDGEIIRGIGTVVTFTNQAAAANDKEAASLLAKAQNYRGAAAAAREAAIAEDAAAKGSDDAAAAANRQADAQRRLIDALNQDTAFIQGGGDAEERLARARNAAASAAASAAAAARAEAEAVGGLVGQIQKEIFAIQDLNHQIADQKAIAGGENAGAAAAAQLVTDAASAIRSGDPSQIQNLIASAQAFIREFPSLPGDILGSVQQSINALQQAAAELGLNLGAAALAARNPLSSALAEVAQKVKDAAAAATSATAANNGMANSFTNAGNAAIDASSKIASISRTSSIHIPVMASGSPTLPFSDYFGSYVPTTIAAGVAKANAAVGTITVQAGYPPRPVQVPAAQASLYVNRPDSPQVTARLNALYAAHPETDQSELRGWGLSMQEVNRRLQSLDQHTLTATTVAQQQLAEARKTSLAATTTANALRAGIGPAARTGVAQTTTLTSGRLGRA